MSVCFENLTAFCFLKVIFQAQSTNISWTFTPAPIINSSNSHRTQKAALLSIFQLERNKIIFIRIYALEHWNMLFNVYWLRPGPTETKRSPRCQSFPFINTHVVFIYFCRILDDSIFNYMRSKRLSDTITFQMSLHMFQCHSHLHITNVCITQERVTAGLWSHATDFITLQKYAAVN